MCDIIVKKNLKTEELPEFVYKVVQKVGPGEYISTVMGEPMLLGEWMTAPHIPNPQKKRI